MKQAPQLAALSRATNSDNANVIVFVVLSFTTTSAKRCLSHIVYDILCDIDLLDLDGEL